MTNEELTIGNYKYTNFEWYRVYPTGMVLVSADIEDVLESCRQSLKSQQEQVLRDFVEWCRKQDKGMAGISRRTHWTLFGIESEVDAFLKELEGK